MSDHGLVAALRFDAGSLSLNLVATVGRRFADPVERLPSRERLAEWLAAMGFGTDVVDDDVARVRRLREHLHELFRAAVDGAPPPAAALAAVNAAVAAGPPQLAGEGLARTSLDSILALIAADAIRILAGGERDRLRACAADDCRMVYLTHGRRERRWCSSAHCGNRVRVAAHRARR
jgi:predicted RNA-binding Zn ribbon-like protein